MPELEVTYLFNSGFVVKSGKHLLIFDYYLNPTAELETWIKSSESVWVFSSHRHADHFNPVIGRWQDKVAAYFFSDDIRYETGVDEIAADKVVFMAPYQKFKTDLLSIATYGSTDEGVSFYVEVDGWRIFHAGDLNWWHWQGDTDENIRMAEQAFRAEMAKLAGLELDIAFFPVDSRLQECRAMGVEVFCRTVIVDHLIAMHCRNEAWTPPVQFPDATRPVNVWCPVQCGEGKVYKK